jgi:hypothetical protein
MGAVMEKSTWSHAYTSLGGTEEEAEDQKPLWRRSSKVNQSLRNSLLFLGIGVVFFCTLTMLSKSLLGLVTAGGAKITKGSGNCASSTTRVPQYFDTELGLWAGPTATGRAPFLAQTNPVSFAPTATFVPNAPLETAVPIVGQGQNQSIFQLMGQLSPYFPNPSGFGVAEYPLPLGANITHVQVSSSYPVDISMLIIRRCCQDMGQDILLLELMSSP